MSSFLYRIYYEPTQPLMSKILITGVLNGATIYDATGIWQGKSEETQVIEVIGDKSLAPVILDLAKKLKEVNYQEAVLVISQRISVVDIA